MSLVINYMNDKIREQYFLYFVQTLSALEEQINLKKCQKSKKKIFMNFLDIFMWVIDGGWKYILWKCFGHHIMVRKLVWQKAPIIFDLPQIYPLFYWTFEVHSIFSHLWSKSVDLNFYYVIRKSQSSPTQR